MNKRIIVLVLTVFLLFINNISVFASPADKMTYAESIAPELKELGMFVGTGSGFELERAANRAEGLTMLIRLLGKEEEAKNGTWEHPFKDVPEWADKIVGYAYNHKLTSGISADKFGSTDTVSAVQYLTFVLRALGYSDSKEIADFTWDKPYELASKIGLIGNDEYRNSNEFLRADVAIVSYNALSQTLKRGKQKLKYILTGDSKNWNNIRGEGDLREAGVFNTKVDKLVTIDKTANYDSNLSKLNKMLKNTFGCTYVPTLTHNGSDVFVAKFLYDEKTKRYGLRVYEWRKSYDSTTTVNNALNCVLETFYFLCGDKEVSYALWSCIDAAGIYGEANTDDYGFKDTATNSNGFTMEMNGIEIEVIRDGNANIFYFK